MTELSSVCVFCGSSPGTEPSFAAAAVALGTPVAQREIELVYGGASVGLMGILADAALAVGGRVTGVITEALSGHEIAHGGLARLDVVTSMHQRKHRMAELADAFIMLPGGFGTFEKFTEAVTWASAPNSREGQRHPQCRRLLRPLLGLCGARGRDGLHPLPPGSPDRGLR